MGWGLVAASRAKLFGPVMLEKDPDKNDYSIYDMCSEGRRMACGPQARTVGAVVRNMCRTMWKRTTKCVVLLFDNSSTMHPVRAELHQQRYKPLAKDKLELGKAEGKVVVGGQLYRPAMVPYTKNQIKKLDADSEIVWPKLWATSAGKSKAFDLIRDACISWHHEHAKPGQEMVMRHRNGLVTYPYDSESARDLGELISNNNFGEADFQTSEAAKILASRGTVFVQTIDTDMIIQLLVSMSITSEQQVWLRLMNETLCVHDMIAMYGGSDKNRRASAAFWFLCCNGVDYCKGLTRFGFYVAGMMELASECVVVTVTGNNKATLDTYQMLQALASKRKRKTKGCTWADFETEVHRIMFCLSLFSGAFKTREPYGGPDITTCPIFAAPIDDFCSAHAGDLDESECRQLTVELGE